MWCPPMTFYPVPGERGTNRGGQCLKFGGVEAMFEQIHGRVATLSTQFGEMRGQYCVQSLDLRVAVDCVPPIASEKFFPTDHVAQLFRP